MVRRVVPLVLVAVGLATFFLPLVLIRAPLVGAQKISGWDAVRPGQEKKRSDASLDDALEARKFFVEQVNGTLVTIAKDVKIQVEFNPAAVESYRLVGYENRLMAAEDFNDDRKDAGEIGAGHTVTALYEIIPAGAADSQAPTAASSSDQSDPSDLSDPSEGKSSSPAAPPVDPLKYQKPRELSNAAQTGELLTLKLRYKAPDGDTSRLLEFPVANAPIAVEQSAPDFQFASAVAGFICEYEPAEERALISA